MRWMRRVAAGVLAAGLGAGFVAVRAEDPAPKSEDASPAAPEPEKKKEKFFGDRFAMYLEVRGGVSSMDDFSAPVSSNLSSTVDNTLSFDSGEVGQFTIGWTLPRDRGQYLLTFTGLADGDYSLQSSGRQKSVIIESGGLATPTDALPWWELNIQDGVLHSTQTPPRWNQDLDDANQNGFPDTDEIRYPTTTFDLTTGVPKDLRNALQTWDLYYRREFGGINIRSRWTAGLRYLDYEGSLPMPAWLTGTVQQGFGYSDGVFNRVLLNTVSTTGWGPVGSAEIQFNFLRKRLTLYGMAQVAFLIEKVKSDSGAFTYYALGAAPGGAPVFLPGSGRVTEEVSKTAWNTSFEVGLRCRVLEGFHIILDWNSTGYLDTVLIPYQLSLPSLSSQISQGTTALYSSRDIVTSSVNFGLSFQF